MRWPRFGILLRSRASYSNMEVEPARQGAEQPGTYYLATYPALVARLREQFGEQSGFEAAVGGDFFTVGILEFELLRSVGLPENATVVDVGCGSGRLAVQLAGMSGIHYIGTRLSSYE